MADFRMSDTTRPDGCYVTFHQIEMRDNDAHPRDYLFQDDEYRLEDQARLDAWRNDEWHFIGIRAQAAIYIVRNGTGTRYTLDSPGLWAIESDSGADYLASVFNDEREILLADMAAMGTVTVES